MGWACQALGFMSEGRMTRWLWQAEPDDRSKRCGAPPIWRGSSLACSFALVTPLLCPTLALHRTHPMVPLLTAVLSQPALLWCQGGAGLGRAAGGRVCNPPEKAPRGTSHPNTRRGLIFAPCLQRSFQSLQQRVAGVWKPAHCRFIEQPPTATSPPHGANPEWLHSDIPYHAPNLPTHANNRCKQTVTC